MYIKKYLELHKYQNSEKSVSPKTYFLLDLNSSGSWFKANLGKMFTRPHFISTSDWALWPVPVIPAMQGHKNRRIIVRPAWSEGKTLSQK
jgi:hypothetical protein